MRRCKLSTLFGLSALAALACDGKENAGDPSSCTSDDDVAKASFRILEDGTSTAETDKESCPKNVVSNDQPEPAGSAPQIATPNLPPPAPDAPLPFSLAALPEATNDPTPTIFWTASERADKFLAVIARDASCTDIAAAIEAVGANSATPSTTLTEGTYFVCAFAENAGGSTPATNNGLQLKVDVTAPPDAQAMSASTSAGIGYLEVSTTFAATRTDWASFVLRYELGSTPPTDCSDGSAFAAWTNMASAGILMRIATAAPGTQYSFRVCIYDKAGNVTSSKTATATSKATHTIFATSGVFDGNLKTHNSVTHASGIAGADARCAELAEDQLLVGSWKALLSDSTTNAKDRLDIVASVYNMNPTPAQIATNETDFWDGAALPTAILYDETEATVSPTTTWTGTTGAGVAHANSCADWTTNGGGSNGQSGLANQTVTWINSGSNACSASYHLYCIDQMP